MGAQWREYCSPGKGAILRVPPEFRTARPGEAALACVGSLTREARSVPDADWAPFAAAWTLRAPDSPPWNKNLVEGSFRLDVICQIDWSRH